MSEQTPYEPIVYGSSSKASLTALQRAEIIRSSDIFSKATVEELLYLATISSEVHFKPETTVFREGEIADALYIIIEGKVERIQSTFREVMEPFEVFGLYAVLTGDLRHASVQVLEETYALKIGAQDFFDLVSHNTEIVQSLFKLFTLRMPYKGSR